MQYTGAELVKLTIKDCYKYKSLIVLVFTVVSLSVLTVGVFWKKHYKSESLIYVDNRNVIQPLMKGTAVTVESVDIARNAKEIILGSQILNRVLENSGWDIANLTPIELERVIEEVKKVTKIKKVGDSLIKIEVTTSNAKLAYLTTKNMSEYFVNTGKNNKIEESRSAYSFIEKQAAEYLEKLTVADEKIKKFQTDNPDARAGSQERVTGRIAVLQRKYEDAKLELRETEIKKISIKNQLSGEAAVTVSQSREGKYRKRITDMENQLESLLLTFTETYPDVVRLRRQIEDLKSKLSAEVKERDRAIRIAKKTGETYLDSSIATNPIYQELRSSLSLAETSIDILKARRLEIKELLDVEYDRIRRIQEGDAMMQALTRDYDVNQNIYQELLRKRESARISRSLDAQQKGATFSILEPAKLSLRAYGLRFMHFAIMGLVLGIALPVSVIFFLIQIDGKVRSSRYISETFGVPVLTEVPRFFNDKEHQAVKNNYRLLIAITFLVLSVYGTICVLKFMGKI